MKTSLKAYGLFHYIRANGDITSYEEIVSMFSDKRTSIKSALVELEEIGLIVREIVRRSNGQFDGVYYRVNNPTLEGVKKHA